MGPNVSHFLIQNDREYACGEVRADVEATLDCNIKLKIVKFLHRNPKRIAQQTGRLNAGRHVKDYRMLAGLAAR